MKPFVKSSPRPSRGSLAAGILLLGLLLAGCPPAWGDEKNEAPDASPAAGASASPSPPPKFNVPIPLHHNAQGVKLPYFDNRGKLQMYFSIAMATRVDMDHLDMNNAYMQTYDEKGVPDATVFMKRSLLDLNTRIVTSDIPVTVRRSDFEIVGQKMVFNTQNRVGRMTGHVRMVIFNRQEMSRPTPSPSPTMARPSATPQ